MITDPMFTTTTVKKIGIFRVLQLGDLMCAIPAVRALKSYYPDSEITLIGLPWAKAFADRFSKYFSSFIHFPGYPGLPEQGFNIGEFETFMENIKSEQFDLIFQMQGNGTIVNAIIKKFGARYTIGFDPVEDSITPKTRMLHYPNTGHEIDRMLALLSFIGIHSDDTSLEFPIHKQDRVDLDHLALPVKKGKYVCVHPGSRGNWRQWPPVYFANIADYCYGMGYSIVLTGTKDELQLIKHVTSLMKNEPIIAAGKTSLGTLGILIKESFAIICNCTGVSHMASALKTPAVVISMDGEPWRWAPKDAELQRCIDWTKNKDYKLVLKEVAALFLRL